MIILSYTTTWHGEVVDSTGSLFSFKYKSGFANEVVVDQHLLFRTSHNLRKLFNRLPFYYFTLQIYSE